MGKGSKKQESKSEDWAIEGIRWLVGWASVSAEEAAGLVAEGVDLAFTVC